MRTKEIGTDRQSGENEPSIYASAPDQSLGIRTLAYRRGLLATTSGPVVVAAVFWLVFLVMGAAFSFSTFASELGRELNAGSGAVSFIFGCAMALLYGGGLFSGALADRIGTPSSRRRRVAGRRISRRSRRRWDTVASRYRIGLGFWPGLGGLLHACGCCGAALVRPQSRGGVWHRLVRHRPRHALNAAAREMADRQPGLAAALAMIGLLVAG